MTIKASTLYTPHDIIIIIINTTIMGVILITISISFLGLHKSAFHSDSSVQSHSLVIERTAVDQDFLSKCVLIISSMTRKSWFNFFKCLFVCEAKPNPEQKCMKWSWIFGRIKIKQQQASIVAPERTVLSEARQEQRKHALNVAVATAAAADAAVAAAHAAAHLVKLTDASPPPYRPYDKMIRNFAATRIQCAFRGHLARKAFKALKGLVKLQAMVRGRIVRRQAATTLNHLPSISNLQSTAQQSRVLQRHGRSKNGTNQQFLTPKELESVGWGSWDDNIISVEDMEAMWSRKKEAIAQRQRMLTRSLSHREQRASQIVELALQNKENGRLESTERIIDRPTSVHRRSFTRTKHNSIGDESSFPRSPSLPTYMLTTESAKAKCRSMSMPKQRACFMDMSSIEYTSPRNKSSRHSSGLSLNGESISTCKKRSGTSRSMNSHS